MQEMHIRHQDLTTAEVRSSHLHRLHRVTLFSAAICHITQGSKVIIQDDSRLVAGPGELIIIPANTPLEIINQPAQNGFRSDLLLLSPEIIARFKTMYVQDYPPANLTSLCTPMSRSLTFMWENVLDAVRQGLPVGLQEHQAMGLLLALLHDGAAGPLLIERRYTLTEQVRQLIMLSPAKLWTAQEIARRLAMGTSTLRRRLQRESQSYRQIVEEGAHVLRAFSTAIDDAADRRNSATVRLPVGVEIYGQIPPTLWVSAQSGTLSMSCMSLHH
ncbi:transcriptional regulator [Salmonella enterica subsp. enterica]|nr:transcriptional regulator [Salmonella enterica subsp. enterica]